MFTPSLLVLLASAGLIEARSIHEARHLHALVHQRAAGGGGDATATTLAADAIQSGSFNDGSLETGSDGATQALSLTSRNNFINHCAGKTLTNGLQFTTGSCNGIPMGDIPAKSQMVSSIITFPLSGSKTIESDVTFNITVQTQNLVAGSFTNADATYYAAPQALSGGKVVGHTHVTVQDLGPNLNPKQPLDATQFAFFKGINDAGDGKGGLTAVVTGGLPAGNYRVCTMTSSSNHQPVLMPVAQRGTPDDCTKFTVIGTGTTKNIAANDGSKGLAAASLAAAAVALGPNVNVAQSSGGNAGSTTSTSQATSTNSAAGGKGGKGGKGVVKGSAGNSGNAATTTSTSQAAITTLAAGNGGKGGKGGNAGNSTTAAKTTTSAKTTIRGGGKGVVKGSAGNGGKGTKTASAAQVISTTVVQKVTVIESFFEFTFALGGLPPSVSKKGNQFFVLEQLFEDITIACGAACEEQFTTCTAIEGPGFSFEKCSTQKEACGAAASSQSSSVAPVKITATITVPPTATVTGSVLSETTISTTYTSSLASPTAVLASGAAAIVTSAPAVDNAQATSSACSLTTSTVFVDTPAETQPALAVAAPFSNSTIATGTGSAAPAINTAAPASGSSALGGIAAL
ncbi:uncharacterized protein K444DRAFT_625030 [Hyaloscypha bicolor E]|uniref:Lytic polysaccharide monooxygenase n=1 Tax=Hyaloscypha bicolor E TaxID=1095630 RepID=A0A2J6TR18_9HELO|nr:uncharacterized protein K444DRAFT_625030 [Hyaloscypha bicolor E]PMD65453.1 hypothetical protein K444DRAFT_625030 [Hyaloscypha bicolor E]